MTEYAVAVTAIICLGIGYIFGYMICYVKLRDEKMPPNIDETISVPTSKQWHNRRHND